MLCLSESCLLTRNSYCDIKFTSVILLDVKEIGISDNGNTMLNRLHYVDFPSDYKIKELGRGTMKSKVGDGKKIF